MATATGAGDRARPRRAYGSPTGGRGCAEPERIVWARSPLEAVRLLSGAPAEDGEPLPATGASVRDAVRNRPGRRRTRPAARPRWAPPAGATTGARRAPTSGRRPGRSSTGSAPASSRRWRPPTARNRPASGCSSWTPCWASTTPPGCPPSTPHQRPRRTRRGGPHGRLVVAVRERRGRLRAARWNCTATRRAGWTGATDRRSPTPTASPCTPGAGCPSPAISSTGWPR